MSLGIFLAAGRSMVGMKDSLSPYRMRTENLLPKFVSEKNPFAHLADAPAPATATPPARMPADAVKSNPAKLVTHSLFDPPPAVLPAVESPVAKCVAASSGHDLVSAAPGALLSRETKLPQKPTPCVVVAYTGNQDFRSPSQAGKSTEPMEVTKAPGKVARLAGWMEKFNPLAFLSRRASGANRLRSRGGNPPVQTELSLERVRVMRNDLLDADLEIKPARPGPASPAALPPGDILPRPDRLHAAEPTAWGRLSARFFHAEQPQNH